MNILRSNNRGSNTLFLLPVLAMLFFSACKGDDTPTPSGTKFVFNLTGVKDISMENTAADSMQLSITRSTGSSEKILLSMQGLPTGVTAEFTPDNGLPPFTSKVVIRSKNTTSGIYSPILMAKGATAGDIQYPFKLTTFESVTDCVPPLIGNYSSTEDCKGSPVHPYNATVAADPTSAKNIIIKNFANVGIEVKIIVVCGSNSLVVTEQKKGDYTVAGTGKITNNKLVIDYTLTYSSAGSTPFTTTCTAIYTKL